MANEIYPVIYSSGATLIAVLLNDAAQARDVSSAAWVALASATFANCKFSLTEIGTTGVYAANLPSGVDATGDYTALVYLSTATAFAGVLIQVAVAPAFAKAEVIAAGVLLAADQAVNVTKINGSAVTVPVSVPATLTDLPAAPADWLTAAAVEVGAVTKIQTGLATPTNITAASGVALAADQSGVTIGTVNALAAGAIASIWNALTSGLATVNSIGKRLVDFVTTLVYAAPPAAAPTVEQIRAELETGTGALLPLVKTKTDYLPSATAGAADGVAIVGSVMGKSAVTLAAADVSGNLPVDLKTVTAGVDFSTTMKSSITAAAVVDTDAIVDAVVPAIVNGLLDAAAGEHTGVLAGVAQDATVSKLNEAGVRTAIGMATANLDTQLSVIAADVAGLDGDAMRGTDGANTVAPDNAVITEISDDLAKVKAAVHDSATVIEGVITLANGTTVTRDSDGNRVTVEQS